MKRLKVLLYGDQNLNILDGSAIWLTSLVNILTNERTADVSILLKTPIRRKQVISNIKHKSDVKLINPFLEFKKFKFKEKIKLLPNEASLIIDTLDKENKYDLIITRGKLVTKECLDYDFSKKLIPYITDIDHENQNTEDLELYKKIYSMCPRVFVQTEEMKKFLLSILNISGEKFITLPPTVDDNKLQRDFRVKKYSIVYTGKFASLWKTEELLEAFKEAKQDIDTLTLNIAGDKFQGDLVDKRLEIMETLETTPGINWVGAITRKEAYKLIEDSDLGFAYRSKKIDNDHSVELSTKFLEYAIAGKPVLVRKIKQYVKLLGEDYPLYCDSYEELVSKIKLAFSNPVVYEKAARMCYNASLEFQISVVSKKILNELYKLKPGKTKILFAGHDFKFVDWYIDYFKGRDDFEVIVDQWSGHNKHDYEQTLQKLQMADIIFCEWGLGNALFYSKNKLPGQKLYIRVHRQELVTDYLDDVEFNNVTNVIAISPSIYEEFARIKKIPREKLKLVPNMVDVDRFKINKSEQFSEYNIGILGVLPKLKRLDRAIEIFERLWEHDKKYKLFIKSKLPEDLPWMKNRPDEMSYYEKLFEKINSAPWKENVIFEKHGDDVPQWFSKLNFILSTSDIESFHLAPMEGMASGTIPIIFNWDGSHTIYPNEYIVKSTDEAVDLILKKTIEETDRNYLIEYVTKFSKKNIINKLNNIILN